MRRLTCLALAFACATAAFAADKVVVYLKSGARMEATLVAQDEKSVTLRTAEGTLQLPRSAIDRIEGPGATSPDVGAERPTPSDDSAPPPPGAWPEAEEQRIEDALTRYFAAKDDAGRKAAFAELQKTRLERRLEDLEKMRELGAVPKGLQKHLPVPWRKGAKRGWFNFALPPDYTPAKAWPLVLALHGMPSDGDNLVSWYTSYFPPRGYIVLFPTTIYPSSYWPAPQEKLELIRLVRYVAMAYRLDYKRIYCTGASGGGIGTWHWLATLPELFAAGISFSAAGTIFDRRLEKLKGIPFYVHHGTADPIPIRSAEAAVQAARRYGADQIEFYASEGTGHTPPGNDFVRAFDWLVKQPPKKVSPRYLLESPEGGLPVGYPKYLPFAAAPEPDALAKIRAAYKDKVPLWDFPSQMPAASLLDGLIAVARILDPACDPEGVRREIKRLAEAVRAKAKAGATPTGTLYALNEVFFQAEGFSRDGADPTGESPEGYAADRVLKSRKGSTFALAGLYAAAAGELGLPVYPVVTPYHAFARYDDGTETINIETSEAGGEFDDEVYAVGYGLRKMPSAAALKSKATRELLAAHLAELGGMARTAGSAEKAAAAAKAALALDPDCYGALYLQALAAKDADPAQDALKALAAVTRAWPDYAAPRLIEGELLAKGGSGRKAVEAYERGIAAKLKPYGAAAGFDAELYYRIAAVYAGVAREALKARKTSAVTYLNKFNEAVVRCLKRNPNHAAARKLLQEMGGSMR